MIQTQQRSHGIAGRIIQAQRSLMTRVRLAGCTRTVWLAGQRKGVEA